MSEWLTRDREELQYLADRLKQAVQLSGKKLMKSAGLSRQTLDHWSNGRSAPEPENIGRVGEALAVYGQKLQALGDEFARTASEEEVERREARRDPPPTDELSLFSTG